MSQFTALKSHPVKRPLLLVAMAFASLASAQVVNITTPTQSPLLINSQGAKPNLMISIDNSGSMAFPYHETYGVSSSTGSNRFDAMRSADLNPVYYDPRITYSARVDSSGVALTRVDSYGRVVPLLDAAGNSVAAPAPLVFVSNQQTVSFLYRVYINKNGTDDDTDDDTIFTLESRLADNPDATAAAIADSTNPYTLNYTTTFIPQHIAHTASNPPANGQTFTYAYCRNGTINGTSSVTTSGGLQTTCSNVIRTTITYGQTADVALPADHTRTDCGNDGVCSATEEITNINNWFLYYSTRTKAAATSIGQALANPKYEGLLRLGYMTINRYNPDSTLAGVGKGDPMPYIPGTTTANDDARSGEWLRGVRLHLRNTANSNAFYTWLYNHKVIGGTPLHNSVDKTYAYYEMSDNGSVENPWATVPTTAVSSTNQEMSCRRSFNVLFSDGAWTNTSATNGTNNADFTNATASESFTSSLFPTAFGYRRNGVTTAVGRTLYTPYGGSGTGGLADLTANYFWKKDAHTSLANNISTRAGQPTFWQNMATYTVGYQIQPSREVAGATSGLSFAQIDNYKAQWADPTITTFTRPSWPTGELGSGTNAQRVDDFIQAGFTGGGRGYSARSSDDVRKIFNAIVADILTASGNDAGVAVNNGNGELTTDRLKYLVSYRTLVNSGEVTAVRLEADGDVQLVSGKPDVAWKASDLIPAHDSRNVYTRSSTSTGAMEFSGVFSGLPVDIRAALAAGTEPARIPTTNSNFVDYLRGNNAATDADGKLFRQRTSKLGAMVNPPSVYMGGANDMLYDLGDGDVTGNTIYKAYITKKKTWPAALYIATNAGTAHALSAANGDELAAYMPRRSMKRLLDNAKDDFEFKYILDGRLNEHDIYDEDNNQWKHVVMGTGGRGEPLIYALNSPMNGSSATNGDREPEEDDFLWETGPDTGPLTVGDTSPAQEVNSSDFQIGNITNAIQSGQTKGIKDADGVYTGGEWVALVNSGHFNGSVESTETNGLPNESKHGLLALNPLTGAVIQRIPLPANVGRGMGGLVPVRDAQRRIVAAYAGDAKGNLWRFNLLGAPSAWSVTRLFTTENNRPIYGSPMWRPHPNGGTMVVFATGIMLNESDIADTANNEYIYGIWDPTDPGKEVSSADAAKLPRLATNLLVQALDTAVTSEVDADFTFSKTTANRIDWSTHVGWKYALGGTGAEGERSIADAVYVGKNVFIATTVISQPGDTTAEMCTTNNLPTNYLYGLRALDGSATRAFDTDGDGELDDFSRLQISSGGFTQGLSYVMATTTADGGSDESNRTAPINGESQVGGGGGTILIEIHGTNDRKVGAGSEYKVTDWSRAQYQLNAPPK